ncbi:hypothetical protein, partial [Streptomyces koyangensis]
MAVEKCLAAQGVGHVGIGVVVVRDACGEELREIVHGVVFARRTPDAGDRMSGARRRRYAGAVRCRRFCSGCVLPGLDLSCDFVG